MQRKAGGVNKKLGIQPREILSRIFPMPGQSMTHTRESGQLNRPEFVGFWAAVTQTLSNEENPMVKPLLQQLSGRLSLMYAPKEEPKSKKKDKTIMTAAELLTMLEAGSYVNINTLVTTLAFLIFSPFKFDPYPLAEWFVTIQRSEYALSVPDSVKTLLIFVKYRCLLENIGWDDTEHRFQDAEKKYLKVQLETMKGSHRDQITGAAGAIEPEGDIFTPLIVAATKIIQTPWIPMLSLDESDVGSNESAFIHTYLLDMVNQMGKDYQAALVSSLFTRAQLISQGGAQPAIREQTFLAIVHMVRCLLNFGPIVNVTLLRRAMLILQNFYLWQQPFGRVAEHLITLLQYELLSPGYTFRTFLQRECNVVDYSNPITDTVPSLAGFAYTTRLDSELLPSTTGPNGYTHNKPLIYIYDIADRRAASILTIIDPIEFNPHQASPVTQLTMNDHINIVFPPHPVMLLTILNGLSIDSKIATDELFNIKYMTYEQLKPFYVRLVTFHNRITQTHLAPTVIVRRKEMEDLKTELVNVASEAAIEHQKHKRRPPISELPSCPETSHRWTPRAPNTEHIYVGVDAIQGLAVHPGYPVPSAYDKLFEVFEAFVPKRFFEPAGQIQNPAHVLHQAALQLATTSPTNASSNSTFNYSVNSSSMREDSEYSTSRALEEGPGVGGVSTIRPSSLQKSDLTDSPSSHNAPTHNPIIDPPSATKRTIRLAVVGSAKHLGRVVTAYQKIMADYPQFSDYLDVKFMIIPTGENWLGNYLARNDLWYFRHVFATFTSPTTLIPWIRDDETRLTPQTAAIGQSYPSQFFRACAIQYAQHAHYNLPITIYKAVANRESRSSEHTTTIYFIQRLELGTAVAVDEFRSNALVKDPKDQSFAGMSADQIQQQKGYVQPQLEMTLGYSKCDLLGVVQPEIVEEMVSFQSLTLSNIPTKGTTASTQILAPVDDDKVKKKVVKEEKVMPTPELLSATQNDVTAVPDPISSTLEAFIFAPRVDKAKIRVGTFLADPKQHLYRLNCSSSTNFKVRIDGTIYGPFKSIQITPCTSTVDQLAKFNVQTFFPIGQSHHPQ